MYSRVGCRIPEYFREVCKLRKIDENMREVFGISGKSLDTPRQFKEHNTGQLRKEVFFVVAEQNVLGVLFTVYLIIS